MTMNMLSSLFFIPNATMSQSVFPVYLPLKGHLFHPHPIFEGAAYLLGFLIYFGLLLKERGGVPTGPRMALTMMGFFGGVAGCFILQWFVNPTITFCPEIHRFHLITGKTIVGGLIGGWIGVEIAKRIIHVRVSTGDAFVLPLCLSIALGRVGCFLTGLSDHTYGIKTSLPWGVNFGDGIPRHPTQLYEILFLGLLAWYLVRSKYKPHQEGDLFKKFMICYMGFRFLVEFIKPGIPLAGLTALQWAALATLFYYRHNLSLLIPRHAMTKKT